MPGTGPLGLSVLEMQGVGPVRGRLITEKLGLMTVGDLIANLPRRYLDYSKFTRIANVRAGEPVTLAGRVVSCELYRPPARRKLSLVIVRVRDESGWIKAVWFNQPWLQRSLQPGTPVILSGTPTRDRRGYTQLENPLVEVGEEEYGALRSGRILPVYRLTDGLSANEMRRLTQQALALGADAMPDWIPPEIHERRSLPALPEAWVVAHTPERMSDLTQALRAIKYQEFFVLQVGLALARQQLKRGVGIAHAAAGPMTAAFRASLPFSLTGAQERAIAEIAADMESGQIMNRLVQGDVGSGKTLVAAAAIVKAIESRHQAALMAPTALLAEQHVRSLRPLLEPLGVTVVQLDGSLRKRERAAALATLETGDRVVAIGTQALIQDDVKFRDLSLVVIDEQHRFGVNQRQKIWAKRTDGRAPDMLVMTATPIPRTVAMSLYGDMALSVMNEKPPGRQPVRTVWRRPADRGRIYDLLMRRDVPRGAQGYVIAPLVEESDRSQSRAATQLHQELQAKYPDVPIGLVHGKMKPEEKEAVMSAFRRGDYAVLVATSVIEVGVDVPAATVIIIEEADRFGLAQLHQLRGRVGRGNQRSHCVLIADPRTDEGVARLEAMQQMDSGFELAERDLALRGPGDYLGTAQSGWGLQFADLMADRELLEAARADAFELVESGAIERYPSLGREALRRWGDRLGLAMVG